MDQERTESEAKDEIGEKTEVEEIIERTTGVDLLNPPPTIIEKTKLAAKYLSDKVKEAENENRTTDGDKEPNQKDTYEKE